MAKKPRKKQIPKGKHGGWRPGAGRPRKPGAISHDARPSEPADIPQHVTLRLAPGVSLARPRLMKVIRRAIEQSHKDNFKVHEFNVLADSLQLITTASSKRALSSGIAGLGVRLAYHVNSALARTGKLFAHRYVARYLRTPREVRDAIRSVLLSRMRAIDPFSSAAWFDGWVKPVRAPHDEARPTAKATVWLLTSGWKKHGLLRLDEARR